MSGIGTVGTGRLRELADNYGFLADIYRGDEEDEARRCADLATALRALIAARELAAKWGNDETCDLAPYECADELTAIIGSKP